MSEPNSYSTILRSSAIIGSSTAIRILIGLVRLKIAALYLGPVGIGLIGLYNSLINMTANLSSLGLAKSGVRRVAAVHAEEDETTISKVRGALFWGTLGLSIAGALLFLSTSGLIARGILQRPDKQPEVAWLALGVMAGVLITYQTALLTGFRRIGDLARVRVISAVVSAVAGVAAVALFGEQGLVAFVLAVPIATLIIGRLFLRKIKTNHVATPTFAEMRQEWGSLASLGIIFVISGFVCMMGDLAVRTMIQRQLGPESLGHFQALWTISVTNLGLILGAMSTDFYPRLSAVFHEPAKAVRLINEQTEVALLLCAPLLLIGLAFAPLLLRILYSAEFLPASEVLRLQFVADVLKVVSWPLGISLMAAGAGKTYFGTELTTATILVGVVFFALPYFGLHAVGLAYFCLYACYAPLVYVILKKRIGFRYSRFVIRFTATLLGATVVVFWLAKGSELIAAGAGLILAIGFGMFGVTQLAKMANLEGRLGRLVPVSQRVLQKVGL